MSKKRLILRVVLGLSAALAVARLSVSLFPLHAVVRDQMIAQEGPVQVNSGMTLRHSSRIAYPEAARKQRIEGDVVAEITLDESGQVTDARILSGPEQLRKAVLSAVLQWHYDPSKLARRVATVTVRFRLAAAEPETRATKERLEQTLSHKIYEAGQGRPQPVELKQAPAQQDGVAGGVPGGVTGGVLGGVRYDGLSDTMREALQGRLPRVGDPFNDTSLHQLRDVLVGIDRHLLLQAKRDREGNYWLIVGIRK